MPKTSHVHQYHRVDIGQPQVVKTQEGRKTITTKEVWVMKCKNCTHYIRMRGKWSCPFLTGMIAICNRCEQKFQLDRRALRMSEPCCASCVKTKKAPEIQDANKFFDNLLETIGLEDDIK